MVEAVHVGEPSLDDPKRTIAPDITKENMAIFKDAISAGKPAAPAAKAAPTGVNEPPRSDQPSEAPVQLAAPEGGTGVGVSIVSAPSGSAQPIPMRWSSRWGPSTRRCPPPKSRPRPLQVNDIKPGDPRPSRSTRPTARRRSPRPI